MAKPAAGEYSANQGGDIKKNPVPNLQADPTAYVSSYETSYWNKVLPNVPLNQITTWLQQNPGPASTALINGAMAANVAGLEPDNLADKVFQTVALAGTVGVLTAGVGGAAAAAGAGAVGSGAAAGAAGAAAQGVLTNGQLNLKNIAIGAAMGGLGGYVSSTNVPQSLSNSTGVSLPAAQAITKGAVGAIGSGLSGGNPVVGGLAAAGGSLAGSGAGALGASSGVASGIGKLVSTGIGSTLGSSSNNNSNIATGVGAGLGAIGSGMATTAPQTTSGNVNTGLGLGNTLLGTVGGVLGNLGTIQQGNANGNVLSNTQAGSGIGTNTSYTGPGGTATINNGAVKTGLTGGLNTANTQLGNFAGQQSQIANSFNGVTPTNVQNAINSQAQQKAPAGTQAQLQQQSGLQGQVQNSQMGLINQGQNQLNNPLTQNLQGAAQNQLNTAGSDFTNTYNTQLAALNQQLALPAAQAQSQLNDAEFGRGQLGTSGGALQTQAFATGLGQAFMGNQNQAYNQAMAAQNSATNNAATLNNAANSNLSTANGLLANAYGQFNNTSALNTNTANSIFNQNSQISQLGNQYGQQNLNNQITSSALPAQLAGAYGANANAAITGAGNLNNIGLSGFNAALGAGTQQGNQYNNAMSNAAKVVSSGQTTNGLAGIGNMVNGVAGNGLLSGIGSVFSGLTSGGGGSSPTVNYGDYANVGNNNLTDYSNMDLSQYYTDPSYQQLDFGP